MKLSYLASEFHHFDSCLMSLKKLDDYPFDINTNCFTYDLGCAAYFLLHRFRLLGRKGKCFYFDVSSEEEEVQFREMIYQYSSCEFHDFDAKLMSIKRFKYFLIVFLHLQLFLVVKLNFLFLLLLFLLHI